MPAIVSKHVETDQTRANGARKVVLAYELDNGKRVTQRFLTDATFDAAAALVAGETSIQDKLDKAEESNAASRFLDGENSLTIADSYPTPRRHRACKQIIRAAMQQESPWWMLQIEDLYDDLTTAYPTTPLLRDYLDWTSPKVNEFKDRYDNASTTPRITFLNADRNRVWEEDRKTE